MAYDKTKGGTGGLPDNGRNQVSVISRTIDFSVDEAAQNDVFEVLYIPAKTLVLGVQYQVLTAEGGTLTFDIGDGDDVDGYIDGANGNTLGSGFTTLSLTAGTPDTVTGYSNGKYYAAADTIDIKLLNAADAAVITVTAVCVELL